MSDSKVGAVVRVSLGNFLEMYDFMVFGYYAAAIGRAFFPTQNEYASLMLSFMTFGTGYLMRPLGAIFLGVYIDHHGRRKVFCSRWRSWPSVRCRSASCRVTKPLDCSRRCWSWWAGCFRAFRQASKSVASAFIS